MSKSKGKLYTVPELLELGYSGRDLRLLMLKQHYRAPLPFDLELVDEAKKLRGKLNNFVAHEMKRRPDGESDGSIQDAIDTAETKFRAALADDLNTSVAFAVIHEFMNTVNRLQPSKVDADRVVEFMQKLDSVFGVLDPIGGEVSLDEEIQGLIQQRRQARKDRDFALADQIRDDLLARGIELVDTPQAPNGVNSLRPVHFVRSAAPERSRPMRALWLFARGRSVHRSAFEWDMVSLPLRAKSTKISPMPHFVQVIGLGMNALMAGRE